MKELAADLTEFIHQYGPQLAETAADSLRPVFNPDTDELPDLSEIEAHRTKHSANKFAFFPSQKEKIAGLLAGLQDKQRAWFVGEMGVGKAQPLYAKILTPTGWKTMGKIRIGDMVINPEGGTSTVLGVYPQGKKEIFRVKFQDGTSTDCCGDHLWKVNTCLRKFRGQAWKILSLKDILRIGLKNSSGNYRFQVPMNLPVVFDNKDATLPIDPYLLGLLLGDGSFSRGTTTFSTADDELISSIRKVLPLGNEIKKASGDYSFRIIGQGRWGGNKLNTIIKEIGLCGKDCYEKSIPLCYKYSSVDDRLAILQGLMDTDGSVQSESTGEFCTTSYNLFKDVVFIARSLGGLVTHNQRITMYSYKGEKKQGRPSWRVRIKLPTGMSLFRLKRKKEICTGPTKYPPAKIIREAKVIGKYEAQCIRVDNPNGLYVTDDFIVTHNTSVSLATAWLKCKNKKQWRALVMCPGHLVRKWKREIDWLIPDVYCEIIEKFNGIVTFHEHAKRWKGPAFAVISKETAKLGLDVDRPCAAVRRAPRIVHIHAKKDMRKGDVGFRKRDDVSDYDVRYHNAAAFQVWRAADFAACPHCGEIITAANEQSKEENPVLHSDYVGSKHPRRCAACDQVLFTNARGFRSNPHIDRYIQRRMKKFFDFFIADEVHELANAVTIQGNTFGTLAETGRRVVLFRA